MWRAEAEPASRSRSRRLPLPLAPGVGFGARSPVRRRPVSKFFAQLLHLLQEALKLVLGAMELPGEPRHVRPPGEAQIPQHEIGEIRADPCYRCDVLGAARQQQAEA